MPNLAPLSNAIRRPLWVAGLAALWLAPQSGWADEALDEAFAACINLDQAAFEHDWAATLTGWTQVANNDDMGDLVWAWLILNESRSSIADRIVHETDDAMGYEKENLEALLPSNAADGWLIRFDHISGWHMALDLDHEQITVSCRLWHSDDRWADIMALAAATPFPVSALPDNTPVREVWLSQSSRANGVNSNFYIDAAVLSADVLPETPRSYVYISADLYSPEDRG